jgi:hypothetical protein
MLRIRTRAQAIAVSAKVRDHEGEMRPEHGSHCVPHDVILGIAETIFGIKMREATGVPSWCASCDTSEQPSDACERRD